MRKLIYLFLFVLMGCGGDIESFQPASNGTQSGSYANILQLGNYLYLVSINEITTLDITDRSTPVEIDRQGINADVESLYHSNGVLFIGSRQALFLYEIGSDGIPQFRSTSAYSMINDRCSRDPVVVNDTMAYVTISAEIRRECNREILNELRLYDITDITAPVQVNTVQMINPKGLALDNNWLFICEKDNGLKVFDVSNDQDIELIHHFEGFSAFDVISQNGLLLVVGPDNLYQYDYSIMDNMQLISTVDL